MKKAILRAILANERKEFEKENHITIENMIKEPEKEVEVVEVKVPSVEVKEEKPKKKKEKEEK